MARKLTDPVRWGKSQAGADALGLATVQDLIWHLPFRYEDRRGLTAIGGLAGVAAGQAVTVSGTVSGPPKLRSARGGRLKIVSAVLAGSGGARVKASWFNQPWMRSRLAAGSPVTVHGRWDGTAITAKQTHFGEAGPGRDGLTPAYPAAEGITSEAIAAKLAARRDMIALVPDPLPAQARQAGRLPGRAQALDWCHFPESEEQARAGRRRLALDELCAWQLRLDARRAARQARPAPALEPAGRRFREWWPAGLPWTLTEDQAAAAQAVLADMRAGTPMQRLLLGEVGSGKTAVAAAAAAAAAEQGLQAMLVAPTETLARQHHATLSRLLPGWAGAPALLAGSCGAAERRDVLAGLASGEILVACGTHALLEASVQFKALAVSVIDEQHRFGVAQRAAAEAERPGAGSPHLLAMTATPIPRTLAFALHGGLDVSWLRQRPGGRAPAATHLVHGARRRARAYELIREEAAAGRQSFVVCPLVQGSGADGLAAVADADGLHGRLAAGELSGLRLALLHGQMPAQDKQDAMEAFQAGGADVLVCTQIVEVGVDVPNATVMLVEDAERFGLAALHQLRGRVGRGAHPGVCLLACQAPSERLEAVCATDDGFELAELDLALRGAGEMLGMRQSGLPDFRVADLASDHALLEPARRLAAGLARGFPQAAAALRDGQGWPARPGA